MATCQHQEKQVSVTNCHCSAGRSWSIAEYDDVVLGTQPEHKRWPNGWMNQECHLAWSPYQVAYWSIHGGRPRPRPHCAIWGPTQLPAKGAPPNFRPMSVVTKWLDGSRYATWYGRMPRHRRHCVRWGPSFPTERHAAPSPTFRPTLLWHGCSSQLLLST